MRSSAVAPLIALLAQMSCARFVPLVAVRPVPYRADTTFALAGDVAYRPDLDDHRFPTDATVQDPAMRTDPAELAATPELVRQCLATRAIAGGGAYRRVAASAAAPGAFTITLALTMAEPGWMRGRADTVSAGADAPGASGSASATMVQPWSGAGGHASLLLEIRSPQNDVVDRVHLAVQRQPSMGEPLDARADALCVRLLSEVDAYLSWRIGGG